MGHDTNGLRYLWTDAFGLVLLVSLHRQLGDRSYLDEAEQRPRERKHAELGVELQLCPTAARRFNNRVDMVLVRPGGKLSAQVGSLVKLVMHESDSNRPRQACR
jgi:hypothetical protein